LFPAHSPASGSFLALTEGNTPGVERTAPYGRTTKYGHQQTGLVKSRRGSWSSKEGVVEDYFFHHNHPVSVILATTRQGNHADSLKATRPCPNTLVSRSAFYLCVRQCRARF
jgi:hypothetical protein